MYIWKITTCTVDGFLLSWNEESVWSLCTYGWEAVLWIGMKVGVC